jgi:hypothetical protein
MHIDIHVMTERFEPMISVFERAKTVRAFDRSATVIGSSFCMHKLNELRRQILDNRIF